ncbi:MAG: hypothetical protein KAH23_01120 [Kiritimatiellae bacterium]|nr:hypothetical protein [Kiritimatiellia bacterium]
MTGGIPTESMRKVLPFLIITVGVFAYLNSFAGVFVFDDFHTIIRNPFIGDLWAQILNSTRPVVNFTFFLNYKIGGFKAADYHAVNLLIHIIAGLLLFGIIRRTLELPGLAQHYGGAGPGLAAAVSAIWLVHPIQTAGVTYIVQRAESLMGLFYLLTLYCAVAGCRSSKPHRWHTAAIVSCAVGMATKPVMVTAPFMVLLYDRTFVAESFAGAMKSRWKLYAGLASTWLILVALLLVPNESSTSAGFDSGLISPMHYLLTQCSVVPHYLKLVFLSTGLCLDYAWLAASPDAGVILCAVLLFLLLAASVWLCACRNGLGFAGLFFFVVLAPSSSFIPVADYAFDHRMYLPLAGVVVVFVFAGYEVLRNRVRPWSLAVCVCVLIVVLAGMTYQRNEDFQSEETMWRDVVEKSSHNLRARNDLAVALSENGKASEAIAEYRAVLAGIPESVKERFRRGEGVMRGIVPANSYQHNYFRAHANLGLLKYNVLGDKASAVEHYRAALMVYPHHEGVRAKLRVATGKGDRPND